MSLTLKKMIEPVFQASAMADIAFLLIIFFMITRVLTSNMGIEHQLQSGAQDSQPTLTINLDSETALRIGDRLLETSDPEGIRSAVQAWHDANDSANAMLITADHIPYGLTILILDILRQEGFEVFLPIGNQRTLYTQ